MKRTHLSRGTRANLGVNPARFHNNGIPATIFRPFGTQNLSLKKYPGFNQINRVELIRVRVSRDLFLPHPQKNIVPHV